MAASPSRTRFSESTRGRIVDLLRRDARTVEELAAALAITDNAVRLHLGALERDGIVRSVGVRRSGGAGKPATVYEITPASEPSFSNAYVPFLSTLLSSLGDRLTAREIKALMRDVGKRLAAGAGAREGDVKARVALGSSVLNELGGLTTVERGANGASLVIRGCGCPLSVAVKERREVCHAVETLLCEITGADVREHCDRTDRPRCRFEVLMK